MRLGMKAFFALILTSCFQDDLKRLPLAPNTPIPTAPVTLLTSVSGYVIDESAACIAGATLTVVRGQALGRSVQQRTPCNAWSYDGGFILKDLTPGVALTVRVSAAGYAAQESTLVAGQVAPPVLFSPSRIP